MSAINGVGAPRLEITRTSGELVTIDLPMPQRPGGNAEEPNQVVVTHDAFDHEEIPDYVGYRPRFSLDYASVLDGVDLLKLRFLLERAPRIVLIPHVDLPGRKFEVRLERFSAWRRGGAGGVGTANAFHQGVTMTFISTRIIDAIPFPQAGLSGRTWADFGNETWANHAATVWHFMT